MQVNELRLPYAGVMSTTTPSASCGMQLSGTE